MAEKEVINIIKKYLKALQFQGIPVKSAVLFGSISAEKARDDWSDIDVLIISSKYDISYSTRSTRRWISAGVSGEKIFMVLLACSPALQGANEGGSRRMRIYHRDLT